MCRRVLVEHDDATAATQTVDSCDQVMSVNAVAEPIQADRVEPVLVPQDCLDGFGWAYWWPT